MNNKPQNLKEAIILISSHLTAEDKNRLSNSSPASLHFNFGMAIRNFLGLWDRERELTQWFHREMGIFHADDMSDVIIRKLLLDIANTSKIA